LTTLFDVNQQGSRGEVWFVRCDRQRAFRAAVRHSRRVRFLRIALPAVVILVPLAVFGFNSLLNPLKKSLALPVDFSSVLVSGTKIMMQQPRIAGFTKDNRRYDLTAQAAGQDLTKPDLLELQGVRATMETQDSAQFEMTAQGGMYNTKNEMLLLNNNIVVTSTNGYEALLSEAELDVRTGKIVSHKPVYLKNAKMSISANRMEVENGGDVMRFERGVTVVMLPESATTQVSSVDGRKR
jgi:lipopolysaccharide export system protein LptC